MENNIFELFSKLLFGGFSQPQNNYYPNSSYPSSPYGNSATNSFDNSSLMPLLLSLMSGSPLKGMPEPFAALMAQQKNSPQSGEQHEKVMPHDEIIL